MLSEVDARAIAQKVVDAAKATAHVDTGALKRSISYTYVKNEIIFRQLFYGAYHENSRLEDYANQYIPRDQPWKLISTSFTGEVVEVGRSKGGRATRNVIRPYDSKQTTTSIKRLIEISRARKAKEEAEDGET